MPPPDTPYSPIRLIDMIREQSIAVRNDVIGPDSPVFVIGEMSGNHNGDLDRALRIVDAVADSGAQALKFQTYTADTLTIDCDKPHYRVTLDTAEDFELIRRLIDDHDAADLSVNQIIDVLDVNPDLARINMHVEQNELGEWRSQ